MTQRDEEEKDTEPDTGGESKSSGKGETIPFVTDELFI